MNESFIHSSRNELYKNGAFLALMLNHPEHWVDAHARIEELVVRLTELVEEARKARPKLAGAEAVKSVNASIKRYETMAEPINEILSRSPSVHRVVAVGKEGPLLADVDAGWPSVTGGHSEMRMVVELTRMRLIERLRKCAKCGKWMFATRPQKIYCEEVCQQANWRSTQEFKQHNREYQRRYYRDVLSPRTARHLRKAKKTTSRGESK